MNYKNHYTPLLGYGTTVLLAVMAVITISEIQGRGNLIQAEILSKQTELSLLKQIDKTEIWDNRLSASKDAKNRKLNQLWRGETGGMISAFLQEMLQETLRDINASNVRISIDPNPTEINKISTLNYKLTCNLPPGKGIVDFLSKIANHPQIVIVSSLQVTNSVRDQKPSFLTVEGFVPIYITSEK